MAAVFAQRGTVDKQQYHPNRQVHRGDSGSDSVEDQRSAPHHSDTREWDLACEDALEDIQKRTAHRKHHIRQKLDDVRRRPRQQSEYKSRSRNEF